MPDSNDPFRPNAPTPYKPEELLIRSANVGTDSPVIQTLYESGLLSGELTDNDTAADIDHLEEAYFSDDGWSNFWVAQLKSADENAPIIGMIGVQYVDEHTVEMKRLRVDPQHRHRGVGTRLLNEALAFCRDKGYLKVILDTRIDQTPIVTLFQRFGFQFNRHRDFNGKMVLDFYLDLYRHAEVDWNQSQQ